MHINEKLKMLAVLAATAVALTGCASKTDNHAPQPVMTPNGVRLTSPQLQHIRLYTVEPETYRRTIETTGTVDFDANQATSVLAPMGGPVSRLLVSLGEHVIAGQPLALVQSPDFAAAIGSYRKALATARTNRKLADLDQDLLKHNGVSWREAEQAQADAANADADRDAALQQLVSLNIPSRIIAAIRDGRPTPATMAAVIRSPIAGTIVERLITPGQLLQAGTTPCFTVANLSRVWVMAQLYDSDLEAVKVGDPAEVRTGLGGDPLPGIVENIAAEVDPDTRSVAARVVVANAGDILKRQMYVRVSIQARTESTGLLVPVGAILHDDENLPFVYIVQQDGSFARRHVSVGYRAGDKYDLTRGVKAGDRVVIDGGIFVQFVQNQ
jgi:cobalt-zinc-cadmium efflux system membrane fusion protein